MKTVLSKYTASLIFSVSIVMVFAALVVPTQTFASEIQLPAVATSLEGEMAYEALLEVLKVENIPQIIEKFKPIQAGLEWTPHPVEKEGEVSIVHLSFRRVDVPAQEATDSAWGFFKRKVTGAVSAIASAATSIFASGEFIGEVTRSDLSSERRQNGFRLDVELGQSSLVISSLVTHFSIEIIFIDMGTAEAPAIHVILDSALEPGLMFPGMRNPEVANFIESQLGAWAEAVRDAAAEQQVRLLSLSRQN